MPELQDFYLICSGRGGSGEMPELRDLYLICSGRRFS